MEKSKYKYKEILSIMNYNPINLDTLLENSSWIFFLET